MRKGNCGTCHFEKTLLEEEPCNRCDDNNSEWKSGKIYFAIDELEKLRAELHETAEMHIDGDYYLRDEWIDEYIDNHISELKGENNAK